MLEKFTVIDILNTRSDSVAAIDGTAVKFNRRTAEELGFPPYILFLINQKDKQFAIKACKKDTPNALPFSKSSEEQKYKITVRNAVITQMIRKMAGWSAEETWNVPGILLAEEQALVYDLKAARKPEYKGGCWPVKRQKEAEAAAKAAAEATES